MGLKRIPRNNTESNNQEKAILNDIKDFDSFMKSFAKKYGKVEKSEIRNYVELETKKNLEGLNSQIKMAEATTDIPYNSSEIEANTSTNA